MRRGMRNEAGNATGPLVEGENAVERTVRLAAGLPEVCRLGLASRGNTHLRPQDAEHAIESGLNYLNWCGKPDGLSTAIAGLGARRRDVVVAVQFKARTGGEAERELASILARLKTDYLDVATLYYVESEREWETIVSPGGAWETLARHKKGGALKLIGLTSHQRELAARWTRSKTPAPAGEYHIDLLMIRYNAAHRGAEEDVFPATRRREMPVVTFTGLRWRDLLAATPEDPPGFRPPPATECYRFCLANPSVTVALSAPGDRAQLEENLRLLDDWRAPGEAALREMRAHGDRVKRFGREFW